MARTCNESQYQAGETSCHVTVTTSVGKKPVSPAPMSTRDLAASNTSAACVETNSAAEYLET